MLASLAVLPRGEPCSMTLGPISASKPKSGASSLRSARARQVAAGQEDHASARNSRSCCRPAARWPYPELPAAAASCWARPSQFHRRAPATGRSVRWPRRRELARCVSMGCGLAMAQVARRRADQLRDLVLHLKFRRNRRAARSFRCRAELRPSASTVLASCPVRGGGPAAGTRPPAGPPRPRPCPVHICK